MRKTLACFGIMIVLVTLFAGCSSKAADSTNVQQLKEYQNEIERLKKENVELSTFKDRASFNLTKIEETLYNLKNEGFLPFAISQVYAPELIGALKETRKISVGIEKDELILSMMPKTWSEDFTVILIVYDVYKPVSDMSAEDAGKISTMAGIFKKVDEKWSLIKFTRAFKSDESFSIKGM